MKKISIKIMLLLSVPFFLNAQELSQEHGYFTTKIEHAFAVKPGGELSVRVTNGEFVIIGWDKNQVLIKEHIRMEVFTEAEATRIVERIQGSYEHVGDNVSILRSVGGGIRRDFEIRVPASYNITLKTSGGEINADGITGRFDAQTSGGEISVRNLAGEVDIRTSGGDLNIKNIHADLNARTAGGDINMDTVKGGLRVSTAGGDINLRDALSDVEVKTSGGDINIDNAEGEVNARTSGGSLWIFNCKKSVDAHTSGGNIRLKNIAGSVDAHTSGGDIEGQSIGDAIQAHTSGGDIELSDIKGPVQARTTGGGIQLELTLKDFSKPHGMELSTNGGDIEIYIPAKLPATIRAEIRLSRSRRYWNRNEIYTDFPLTKTTSDEGGGIYMRSEGTINGGGDEILLKTSNGSISIKKLQTK